MKKDSKQKISIMVAVSIFIETNLMLVEFLIVLVCLNIAFAKACPIPSLLDFACTGFFILTQFSRGLKWSK